MHTVHAIRRGKARAASCIESVSLEIKLLIRSVIAGLASDHLMAIMGIIARAWPLFI